MALELPAQVAITLPASNITSGTAYTTTLPSGSYTGLGLAQTIRLQGSSPILLQVSSGLSFPVSNLAVQMNSLAGLSLLGGTTPINLTTSPQAIYSALAMTSGAIQLTYTIPVAGYGWVAGNYTTTLLYSLASTALGNSTSGPGLLTLTIPAFMTAPATLPTFTLNVNNLNFYSTQTVSSSASMAMSTTVPYFIGVRGNSSAFTYSNALGLSTPSNLSLGNVGVRLNSGSAVALSGSNQNLNASAIAVSGGNNQMQTLGVSIAPAGLLGQFVQTGTYTVPLTFTTADATTPAALVGNQTTTSTLTVNVADMQSIVVNDPTTDLTFSSVGGYQNGVSVSKTGHITVSSTSPWTLGVQASSGSFTTGVPVGMVTVGNVSGQTILTSKALSSSAQTITAASQPAVIGQTVGVQYSISGANAATLINKPSGTYSTTVTYILTAL